MLLSSINIDVIRHFNEKSYSLNDVLLISIHYFCNISRNDHHQNGSDKRHKSHQGCACGEEADQQMVGRTIGQGPCHGIEVVYKHIITRTGNTVGNSTCSGCRY